MNQSSYSKIVFPIALLALLVVVGYVMFLSQKSAGPTLSDTASGTPMGQTNATNSVQKGVADSAIPTAKQNTKSAALTPALLKNESVDDITAAVDAGASADANAYVSESADSAALADDGTFTNFNNAYDQTQL